MAIFEVIKYEGDNSTFVWKHPKEDFNTGSQLIVHESQEALFFANGQALDLFGPGRHTLDTQNLPLLRRVVNLPTGGDPAFHCEVYFINRTEQMAVKWGTDSKVQFMEPTYQFPLSIGACGEMSLSPEDSRKLVVKLVGTEKDLSQETLTRYFRAFLMTRVKSYLAQTIREKKISIFEIDEHLSDLSDALREKLIADFSDYGVALRRFFVTSILKPEGEAAYEKFKELHVRQYADVVEAQLRQKVGLIDQATAAQRMVIESQGIAQKRAIEGYTYQQERGFDVAEEAVQNEGIGSFSSAGIGLGMMTGIGGAVGGTVGGIVQGAVSPLVQQPTTDSPFMHEGEAAFCSECGARLSSGSAFCEECGTAIGKRKSACPKCGYVFERPGKFCPKCGAKREG